jgi:hypothetical protein
MPESRRQSLVLVWVLVVLMLIELASGATLDA